MASRFKFKVWDKKKKLLSRPGMVSFIKGELLIPDAIILQYTGFTDMLGEEIYEEDILLVGKKKFRVYWDEPAVTWKYREDNAKNKNLNQAFTKLTVRSYNAYERGEEE